MSRLIVRLKRQLVITGPTGTPLSVLPGSEVAFDHAVAYRLWRAGLGTPVGSTAFRPALLHADGYKLVTWASQWWRLAERLRDFLRRFNVSR